MDVYREAEKFGIKLRNHNFGNQYTTCPLCSHNRKAAHRKLKCLSVKIDADGVCYNCKNCGSTGAFNAKRKTQPGDRGPGPQRRTGGGYGMAQRAALARRGRH